MPFTEDLKLLVRQKSAFRCCICQKIPVEIHHIIPQANGGADDENNAAALCPNCHATHGGNPEWRKKIIEMRDHWYSVASVLFPTPDGIVLNKLNQALIENSALAIKENLRKYVVSLIDATDNARLPNLTEAFLNGLQLDNGIFTPLQDLVAEGPCTCERESCVDRETRVYCYFTKNQSQWVIKKKLFWKCYDEITSCPRCFTKHARGHIGRLDICLSPYKNQESQNDE